MEVDGANGHRFRFERHYDFSRDTSSASSSATVLRSSLVAKTETRIEQDLRTYISGSTLPSSLVGRCCLAILGWDWRKSEVSEGFLRQRTGFDQRSLAAAISAMKQRRS
jgi:hypothetical protein